MCSRLYRRSANVFLGGAVSSVWTSEAPGDPGVCGWGDVSADLAAPVRLFDELFEPAERLSMEVMRIVHDQHDRLGAAAHGFPSVSGS